MSLDDSPAVSATATGSGTDTPTTDLGYWQEFRVHARALMAATLGMSAGMSLAAFVNSAFGPYLIEAFGWSRSAFALMGMISLLTLIFIPLYGRFTDLFGVRRVALVGIVGYPLSCLMLAMMTGDIRVFYGILVFQVVICTSTTASVYCRVVAERFVRGRGLALAVAVCGPAVVSAAGSPLLTNYMDVAGWKAGYLALATYSAVAGALAFALLPARPAREVQALRVKRKASSDYRMIFGNRAFRIIILGAFLCSLPHALSYSQINVMMQEHGVGPADAGFMISVFAMGVVVGRFLAGVALDRFPTYLVALVAMGLPFIGLFVLASGTTSFLLLAAAVALLGLSFGGEGDIVAYFAARYFPMTVYSTVLSLFSATIGLAIASGSGLLSLTLSLADSFALYTLLTGTTVLVGALNFLRLRAIDRKLAG